MVGCIVLMQRVLSLVMMRTRLRIQYSSFTLDESNTASKIKLCIHDAICPTNVVIMILYSHYIYFLVVNFLFTLMVYLRCIH